MRYTLCGQEGRRLSRKDGDQNKEVYSPQGQQARYELHSGFSLVLIKDFTHSETAPVPTPFESIKPAHNGRWTIESTVHEYETGTILNLPIH